MVAAGVQQKAATLLKRPSTSLDVRHLVGLHAAWH